jgi:hypothetical protein
LQSLWPAEDQYHSVDGPDFLHAALDTAACVAFIKESRMNFANRGFPVELNGVATLHAPFLTERRTRGAVLCSVQEIRAASQLHRKSGEQQSNFTKTTR